MEITDRIAYYLETGKIAVVKKTVVKKMKNVPPITDITEKTQIETNFICSEKHRAFFKERIGKGFSFNVSFQKWLKSNTGKTYEDAIKAYFQIAAEKKGNGSTQIDRQFEYNTYIRDFFADNRGKSMEEAINCWKYKKQLPGHNRYEKTDLEMEIK